MPGFDREQIANVATAIRERIRVLEEELAHWQQLLDQCEEEGDQHPVKDRSRSARARSNSACSPTP
jgi:hypothetical protein